MSQADDFNSATVQKTPNPVSRDKIPTPIVGADKDSGDVPVSYDGQHSLNDGQPREKSWNDPDARPAKTSGQPTTSKGDAYAPGAYRK